MIRNTEKWRRWETEQLRSDPVDVEANFAAFEAMLEHARAVGAFPRKDPLEGLDVAIRIARILNAGTTRPNRTTS